MFTITEKQFEALLNFFPDLPTIFGVSDVQISFGPHSLSARNFEHQKIVQKIAEKYPL